MKPERLTLCCVLSFIRGTMQHREDDDVPAAMRLENWVLNQEVICLPGGELTDFL